MRIHKTAIVCNTLEDVTVPCCVNGDSCILAAQAVEPVSKSRMFAGAHS